MLYLALEKELKKIPASRKKSLLKQEAETVSQLHRAGIIRQIYFSERHEAVIIFELGSLDEVNDVLASLPLVKGDYIIFELFELHRYTGFSRLKKK